MATNTPGAPARQSHVQAVQTLRFTVNYNDAGLAAGAAKQWLPQGALVVATDAVVVTGFNAGTTNVLSVGIEQPTYANLLTAAQAVAGTPGGKFDNRPTGTALGPLAAPAQVFALYTQTGTAATAGKAVIVLKYIADNDLQPS